MHWHHLPRCPIYSCPLWLRRRCLACAIGRRISEPLQEMPGWLLPRKRDLPNQQLRKHMWIVKLALRRPYTFAVVALAILIAGAASYRQTPKDIFPEINI